MWYQKTSMIYWYHKFDFFFFFFYVIIKSIFWYKKLWLIWWYHKIIYVISKNHICDITKSKWFLISKHLFCDITKYVEFLKYEMMTPVFYLCYFFYIPADTKFRACALIIFGSYHYSKELKGKNDSWYHTIDLFISQNHNDFYHKINFWQHKIIFLILQIRFSDIKNHNDFVISKNLLCDIIKSNMWCHKFEFLILQNQFWYHKINFAIS